MLLLGFGHTRVEGGDVALVSRRQRAVPAHFKIAFGKRIGNWIEHDRLGVKGRELGNIGAVAGKEIDIDLLFGPIVGRSAIVVINGGFVPRNISRWILMLMDTANRMTKFVGNDTGILLSRRVGGQPAKVHGRLMFGNGQSIGSQVGPRPRLAK